MIPAAAALQFSRLARRASPRMSEWSSGYFPPLAKRRRARRCRDFSRINGAEAPFVSPGCYSWGETFIRSPLHDSRVTRHRRRWEKRSADPTSAVSESRDGGTRRERRNKACGRWNRNWLRRLICFYLFAERASNGWMNRHRVSMLQLWCVICRMLLFTAIVKDDGKKKIYIYIYIYIYINMSRNASHLLLYSRKEIRADNASYSS